MRSLAWPRAWKMLEPTGAFSDSAKRWAIVAEIVAMLFRSWLLVVMAEGGCRGVGGD